MHESDLIRGPFLTLQAAETAALQRGSSVFSSNILIATAAIGYVICIFAWSYLWRFCCMVCGGCPFFKRIASVFSWWKFWSLNHEHGRLSFLDVEVSIIWRFTLFYFGPDHGLGVALSTHNAEMD